MAVYKRAEIVAVDQPFKILTSDIPVPPPGTVRIKLAFSGICHSDVHISQDKFGIARRFGAEKFKGMVLGHEISGYIDQEGPEVDLAAHGLKHGDSILVFPWVGCQECSYCKAGFSNMCSVTDINNTGCGYNAPGGYQTHMIVKPHYLVKAPENYPMDLACMLPCSAGTAYASLIKVKDAIEFAKKTGAKPRLLIVGSGGLGLWAIQLAKTIYVADNIHVIAADIDQAKLDLAATYGADETILWNSSVTDEDNAAVTFKNGQVHAAIDFCGTPSTSNTAVKSLVLNGTLVITGLHGHGKSFSVDFYKLVLSSLNIHGNNPVRIGQLKELIDLVTKHNIMYPGLSYCKLEDSYDVVQKLKQGKIAGRTLIRFDI